MFTNLTSLSTQRMPTVYRVTSCETVDSSVFRACLSDAESRSGPKRMYKRTQIQTSFWLAIQESCLQHFIWIHEMTVEDHWERNREVSVAQTVNFGFYHSEFLMAGWRENSRVLKIFPRQNNGMSRKTLELNEDKLPKVHWHWWYHTLSL